MNSIFISGAANGIGKAIALRFLESGWLVGAYDIAPVEYDHPNLVSGYLDVTDAKSWDAALADFGTHTGGLITVVVNNAGIIAAGNLSDISPDQVTSQVQVNCAGVTLGAQAAKRYLRAGSTVVNLASASAIYGQPGIAVYSASKFYVAGLTEALNLEWRTDRIRVVAIWPLWVKTALSDNDAASVKRLGVRITPEQVAETVWQATHPKSRWQRGKVHYGVSMADKVFYIARKLSPVRLARVVTRLVAG